MKLFVTGGTGFIGAHFLQVALAAGHEVIALRRTPESRPVLPLTVEPTWLTKPMDKLTVDDFQASEVVVHLASPGVSPKAATWRELIYWNVDVACALIETAAAAGVRRIVAAGTCLEYGESAEHYDFIPANAALQPNTLYGASKAAASVALCAHARITSSQLFYGRIFHAYGKGQHEGSFWPSLCQAALSGKDFIMTSGRQIRDFNPVENIASQLLSACRFAGLRPGQACLANLGSGTPISLADFASKEWKRLRAKGHLLVGGRPDRPGEIHRYVPDLEPFFLTSPSAS